MRKALQGILAMPLDENLQHTECGKIWTRKTPNTATFYAVKPMPHVTSISIIESLYFIKMSDCGRCFENKILGKRAKFLIVKMKSKITEIKSLTLSPK